MKKIFSLTLGALLTIPVLAQKEKSEYDFKLVKLSFGPSQKFKTDLIFYRELPENSNRLNSNFIRALNGPIDLDMKERLKRNSQILIKYDIQGIDIKGVTTQVENNTYYKLISYTIKNKIDIFKTADNTLLGSLPIDDGSTTKTIKVGSNFFLQTTLRNSKYPKPESIPNIDASPGFIPDPELRMSNPAPLGFPSLDAADKFMKAYMETIEKKAEALAIELEFKKCAEVLTCLFGTYVYRGYIGLAGIEKKQRQLSFDDFDKMQNEFQTAFVLFQKDSEDATAATTFKSQYNFFKELEAQNDPRLTNPQVAAVVHYNISLLAALNNDVETAKKYFSTYKEMKAKKWQYVNHLEELINTKREKIENTNYSQQNLLSEL